MGATSFTVPISPEVLSWARVSLGIDADSAAASAGVPLEEYLEWEAGLAQPRMTHVRRLATGLRCTAATLLLSEPPPFPHRPRDYRTLPTRYQHPLSTSTLLAIRRAQRVSELAAQLLLWQGIEPLMSIPSPGKRDPEEVAETLRAAIAVSLEEQSERKNKYEAYHMWRLRVEDMGVYVLEGNFPADECRGFSIYDSIAPVIAVTNEDFPAPRTFSLIHECAHLALRMSGLCEVDAPLGTDPHRVEAFCNHVAGAVLVPAESLLQQPIVARHEGVVWDDATLEGIASIYHVSKEVVLRRLLYLGRTTDGHYESKRSAWATAHEKMSTFVPRVTQPRRAFNRNGVRFVELITSAIHAGVIGSVEAADFLATKPKHIDAVERMVAERRTAV